MKKLQSRESIFNTPSVPTKEVEDNSHFKPDHGSDIDSAVHLLTSLAINFTKDMHPEYGNEVLNVISAIKSLIGVYHRITK